MTLPTKLFHYSNRPIESLVPEYYDSYREVWPECGSMKPIGFWVSVEDHPEDWSWFDWCKAEEFNLESLKYKYSVKISPNFNIIHLKSVEEIKSFSLQYGVIDPFGFSNIKMNLSDRKYIYMINWLNVKKEYDGIIISPYQRECRFDSMCSWYYPFDCSSGCIWNLKAIESFELDSIIDIDVLIKPCLLEEMMKGLPQEHPDQLK